MNALHLPLASLALIPLFAACASTTPGAQPHDASLAHHEAMAGNDDREAAGHARQYDPKAREERVARCSGSALFGGPGEACWTSVTNPTSEHLDEAKKHQRMAADHRAASQSLRDAEARACTGLSDVDRDMGPFARRQDIVGVDVLRVPTPANTPPGRVEGVTVTFRAVPGMSAEWLQRAVDCHIARNVALGHNVPEMKYCPLVPNGVSARVTQTAGGFAVAITSSDTDAVPDVVQRGQALLHRD